MRTAILMILLAAGPVCVAGQNPAGQPASTTPVEQSAPAAEKAAKAADPLIFKSEGDFTFGYPADWEVVDMKPMMPVQRMKAEQDAKSAMERKGADCTDVQLTIRHGDPRSVILIMYLEYACLGVELKPSDLGATGAGIAQGLTRSFNVKDPKYGAYTLGNHAFWIERADGSPVDHPEREYKLETTCTLLKKGLTCWLAMAASPDAIATFEASKVALEGDSSLALVPATAFATGR
jgi:hypothetical protein